MPTRKATSLILAGTLAFGLQSGAALALDPDRIPDASEPQTLLKYGYDALKQGRALEAVDAFRLGADQKHLPAQWKLARMFQTGQGVVRDDVRAHRLYQGIADRYSEIPPNRFDRPYVSNAVVWLGRYALAGIPAAQMPSDPVLAEHYFQRAAALYGDANAQFHLGELYSSDRLGVRRYRQAARWYGLASRKGHPAAQAALGQMLFYGKGVRKNRVKGLVYIARAAAAAAQSGIGGIAEIREQAFANASDAQRKAANAIIARLPARVGTSAAGATASLQTFGLKASQPDQ